MNQLALLPLDAIASKAPAEQSEPTRLVRLPARGRQSPRTAVGAPGFLSVEAAAERLGLRPRSVRYLIEHGKLGSQRLGGCTSCRAVRSRRTVGRSGLVPAAQG